jgi:hypothetical protein
VVHFGNDIFRRQRAKNPLNSGKKNFVSKSPIWLSKDKKFYADIKNVHMPE